jgi:predicted esterase
MNFRMVWLVKHIRRFAARISTVTGLMLLVTSCAPAETPSINTYAPTFAASPARTPAMVTTPEPTQAPTPLPVTVTLNITYAVSLQPKVDPQALDVYAPGKNLGGPLVVFAHGLGENKPDYKRFGQALAEAGAVAYVIDWPDFALANSASAGERTYRQVFETLECAVRYARATGAANGGNPAHLVLAGFSLGGGMVAGLAFAPDDADRIWNDYAASSNGPPPQVQCAQGSGPARVDAFAGIAGTYLLGSGPNVAAALRPLFSPSASLAAHAHIPVRLLHGTFDSRVPMSLSEQFNTLLTGAGYDSTLTKFDGSHAVPFEQTIAAIMGLWK